LRTIGCQKPPTEKRHRKMRDSEGTLKEGGGQEGQKGASHG
jgi:hypothetical protein